MASNHMFGPRSTPRFQTVTAGFYHYVSTQPGALAAVDFSEVESRQVTYGELSQRAARLARDLRRLGVVPGDRVPLIVKRGIDMLIGIVAILSCGAQYIPLDGQVVPDSTIHHVIGQAGGSSSTVLVLRATRYRVEDSAVANVVVVDDDEAGEDLYSKDSALGDLAEPDHACYVTFTSDITRTPKGVDVTHRNITNLICNSPGNLGISSGTRVGQLLDISSDTTAWAMLGSLCNGGTVVLRGSNWLKALKQIDVLICTPSILAQYNPQELCNIKVVATTGEVEVSSQRLADLWADHVTYYNCYGRPEATIVISMHLHQQGRKLTVGTPTPNNNIYILDNDLQPVPVGMPGLMWAGGLGVTRGYMQTRESTAERYRHDRFVNDGSAVMYNTGDLGRWLDDGSIDIIGRQDDQVKPKGFRVESEASSASSFTIPDEKATVAVAAPHDIDAAIPDKIMGKRSRGLKFRVAIIYRRLFSVVGLLNIAAVAALLSTGIQRPWLSNLTAMNLLLAVLMRQEFVINGLYHVFCNIPTSCPLWLRARCAKIYHFGGIHSGAAVASALWLLGANISDIICQQSTCNVSWGYQSTGTKTISWMLIGGYVFMLTLAYPSVRKKYHNQFEYVHRFVGWTMLGLFWVQVVLSTNDAKRDESLAKALVRTPPIWMLVVATLSIASSWFWLRKVPVKVERLSDHAVRLHFDYAVPINGSFARLSYTPLTEWHSFATIAAPDAVNGYPKGYSMVVSNAGDWTRKTISNPPERIWIRGIPTSGVMRIATLFNRMVLIGTGSGIGPLLGHIQQSPRDIQLIWSTPDPDKTFGEDICNTIRKRIPSAVIHNTRTLGRPDLVKMGYNAAKAFNAEAVVIIANEKITKKVVYGLESRGLYAFGAIWDS